MFLYSTITYLGSNLGALLPYQWDLYGHNSQVTNIGNNDIRFLDEIGIVWAKRKKCDLRLES